MPRPVQSEIPGTEAPKIPEIEKAARKYESVRDERMALTLKEVEAKRKLIEAVQSHSGEVGRDGEDNLVYRFEDRLVILSDKLTVKVKSADAETDIDDD